MAHAYTLTLLFITFLQLCRAEISGTWYAANVINNGDFSPKPISEIFSSPSPPFSSTNPIVVLPSSSTTAAPPPISTSNPPTLSTLSSSYSTGLSSPGLFSTPPSTFSTQSTYDTSSTLSPYSPTFLERRPPVFELQPLPFPTHQDKPQANGSPNYFLIYQQAPQTLQNLPPTAPQQTFSTSGTTLGDVPTSTMRPEVSSPQTTLSTFSPDFSTPTFSTFRPELSTPQTTFSTFRPELSSLQTTFFQPDVSTPATTLSTGPVMSTPSTFGTFRPGSSTLSTTVTPNLLTTLLPRTTRVLPCNKPTRTSNTPLEPRYPSLRIRMVAPSGSITNINVNPSIPSSTTRKPIKRTTTRRITTTRKPKTKRPGRNSFEGCVRMCDGKKPICAIPLAQTPIDPDKLKGFASICHMACHNSFKKDQYEMLIDGRCGKLRTRIQTVDSNKLKRVELNKAQYTIIEQKPETVVEFSSLPRK